MESRRSRLRHDVGMVAGMKGMAIIHRPAIARHRYGHQTAMRAPALPLRSSRHRLFLAHASAMNMKTITCIAGAMGRHGHAAADIGGARVHVAYALPGEQVRAEVEGTFARSRAVTPAVRQNPPGRTCRAVQVAQPDPAPSALSLEPHIRQTRTPPMRKSVRPNSIPFRQAPRLSRLG